MQGDFYLMKVLIVGGVAAGTKAAAKLMRLDRNAEVSILTKSHEISYAGCGLPYYIGGGIEERGELVVNTPEKFSALTGAHVTVDCEVTAVDTAAKEVSWRKGSGETGKESYDKLIIATGAVPYIPDAEGIKLPGVFAVRTPDDADGIKEYIKNNGCRRAVVCGAGFIGLEMAENLIARGISVTVVEAADTVLPSAFDSDMAEYLRRQLQQKDIRVLTGTRLTSVEGGGHAEAAVTSAGRLAADIIILALGVRPATGFLEGSGIELHRGTIVTDSHMQTNIPDVYAVGDCAEVSNLITGKPQWSAMGSTANITARLLAYNVCGGELSYRGCLGTGIAKVLPDLNCGRTGLTEREASQNGFDPVSALCVVDDKPRYYPGSSSFAVKLIADRGSRRLLGVQVTGSGAVDKIVDIAVTGISMNSCVDDFLTLDLAYAPPFSTAIHPFATACCVLANKLDGTMESFTPAEYSAGAAREYTVIDALPAPSIPGAKWVDITKAEGGIDGIAKDEKLLIVCNRGRRAYMLQNILKHAGYTDTRVLEGGVTFNKVRVERRGQKLPPEEIKRVKGLGCLQDKRYDDVFNVRVITRNGKITADEHRIIAEASEKYGSGEVTMTTRLTLEIQGVRYDRLDELFEFLAAHGLESGGTGSKVRPVVSCKGTTCQYGLIDTFALSERLHEIFYKGYHDLTLPHKFKIAVGGCPNNCVKPDLNDLGIIGQRLPEVDLSKCRGCKVCQVEASCPIKTAKLHEGRITIDAESCNHCGRCIGKCPFGAVNEGTVGYKIFIGGRWGKRVAQGRALGRIFRTEDEVIETVDRAIMLFRNEGVTGERFADTVARLGFDYVENKLLYGDIDKAEIMKKTVKGGATC